MQRPSIASIEQAVCAQMNVTPAELHSKDKSRRVARPRQVVMFLAREITDNSLPQVGKYFSRDHTTVIHAQRTIARICAKSRPFANRVDEIRACVIPQDWRARFVDELAAVKSVCDGLRAMGELDYTGLTYWHIYQAVDR